MGWGTFETSGSGFGAGRFCVMSILVHDFKLYDDQVFEFVYNFKFKQKIWV